VARGGWIARSAAHRGAVGLHGVAPWMAVGKKELERFKEFERI